MESPHCKDSPLDNVSILSSLGFFWMDPLIRLGAKRALEFHDLFALPKAFRTEKVLGEVHAAWERELAIRGEKAFLGRAILRAYWKELLLAFAMFLPYCVICLLQPLFVRHLLEYVTVGKTSFLGIESGIGLAVLLGGISMISILSFSHSFYLLSTMGLYVRSAIFALVFTKSLKLSSAARGKHSTGEIVTLMSVDAERVWQAILFALWLWAGPATVIAAMALIVVEVQLPAIAAIVTLLLLSYLQSVIGQHIGKARRALVKFTDERVKVTNEILQGIRVIKFYAWENPILKRVKELRDKEVEFVSRYQYLKMANTIAMFIGPYFVAFALFVWFVESGGKLTVPRVYAVYALLNVIRLPIALTPQSWAASSEAMVSLRRITKFLLLDEVESIGNRIEDAPQPELANKMEVGPLVDIRQADFSWESPSTTKHGGGEGKQPPTTSVGESSADAVHQTPSVADTDTDAAILALRDVNLQIRRKEFIAVVGPVGAGKSSLVAAILGQIRRVRGAQALDARVAFVSQEHWIQNMTLKENILFGSSFEESSYAAALDSSQMSRDLLQLPHADHTSIGERGINLSGGQKARVSVARALYSREGADLFVIDDALASVDVHVGRAMFESAINGILRDRARVVVLSSNYHLLTLFDRIIVVEIGRIAAMDTYTEIIKTFPAYASSDGESGADAARHENAADDAHAIDALADIPSGASQDSPRGSGSVYYTNLKSIEESRQQGKTIMTEEDREKGAVTLHTYFSYFSAAVTDSVPDLRRDPPPAAAADGPVDGGKGRSCCSGGTKRESLSGILLFTLVISLFVISQTGRIIVDIWVGVWAQASQKLEAHEPSDKQRIYLKNSYLAGYVVLVVLTTLLVYLRSHVFVRICVGASRNMHAVLLKSVLSAPVNLYFDVTPVGRILNRFSKDLDSLDSLLPDFFLQNLQNGFYCLSIVVVCIASSTYFVILMVPIAIAFYFIQSYFRKSSREMKRMDGISRSPMYSLFNEVLQGLSTIRSYGKSQEFAQKFFARADEQTRCFISFWMASRWLAIRLDFVANCIVFAVAVLAIGIADAGVNVDPNYLGLALVYALQLTGLLQWTVRVATETETNMTAVERLLAFTDIPPEGQRNRPAEAINVAAPTADCKDTAATDEKAKRDVRFVQDRGEDLDVEKGLASPPSPLIDVPSSWPQRGRVVISNLWMRYRPGLDPVLRGLDLVVPGGAKVGICGRTGAGKSSLMLALFRIVEPEAGSCISIDGVDISSIDLSVLRSRLTIIPQDPVMFSGTLRYNLDPFGSYSDDQLWEALDRTHLKAEISDMTKFPRGLLHEVSERGENLSVGQRQLLCIARALLRESKVIVMDEATASVDTVTDAKIQSTIRTAFKECTVLTIAHRLETIADSDLVVVMSDGKVGEVGSPHELLQTEGDEAQGDGEGDKDVFGVDLSQINATEAEGENLPNTQPELNDDGTKSSNDIIASSEQQRPVPARARSAGLFRGLVDELGPERRQALLDVTRQRYESRRNLWDDEQFPRDGTSYRQRAYEPLRTTSRIAL